jgi:Putative metal-binding motif
MVRRASGPSGRPGPRPFCIPARNAGELVPRLAPHMLRHARTSGVPAPMDGLSRCDNREKYSDNDSRGASDSKGELMSFRAFLFTVVLVFAGCAQSVREPNDGGCPEGETSTWYRDADGDGHGDPAHTQEACTAPEGHVSAGTDCDDQDADTHPDAAESCDSGDQDCDGTTDEAGAVGESTWYRDADADGHGAEAQSVKACQAPVGYVASAGDCDDADPSFHPGAAESCSDPTDFNCDGSVSFADVDQDGVPACQECDDTDPDVFPGAGELCNGVDDDCDGTVDEPDAADAKTWFADADGDGAGDEATRVVACTPPQEGWVEAPGDCNDGNDQVGPGRVEVCGGVDENCDGRVDEPEAADATTWYVDADGDGHGDPATTARACVAPAQYVADATDCDDTDAEVGPGQLEVCDGIDNDCDGETDEADAIDAASWYADMDRDGFGSSALTTVACAAPAGYVANAGDCDDAQSGNHPGNVESCDGADNDCDGTADEENAAGCSTFHYDYDGDGYGTSVSKCLCASAGYYTANNDDDCYDFSSIAHPGQTGWFTMSRGDGSYDYDCDGSTTPQFTTMGSCSAWPMCDTTVGWSGIAPSCGTSGTWVSSCSTDWTTCSNSTQMRTQACR